MSLALRTSSRLAAVQAQYEIDLVGGSAGEVIAAFMSKRWNRAATADTLRDAQTADEVIDEEFFGDLIHGVVREQVTLDEMIRATLDKPESFARLEPLVRSILRVGVYELAHRIDVPVKVVINEYVEISRDFFDGNQVKLINGVLDSLARKLRTIEIDALSRGK